MDIAATRQQDQQLGLSTNERRMKSYTVGIPKLISFDINVSVNRKSDKRAPVIQNTPIQYDDPSLMVTPPSYKKEPIIVSSGSDDVMHSANNATTHSESIEMVDHDENKTLKELPMILQKLASLNNEEAVKPARKTTQSGFVRSPEISPRKRGSERANNRRTTGRMTPTLGSNRITAQTAPTSPVMSPISSPRSSVVIPNEIQLESGGATPLPSILPPKRLQMVPQIAPRQSLYDSNVARRPRNLGTPNIESMIKQHGDDRLTHSTSSPNIDKRTEIPKREPGSLKRSTTQYNRDIDGFIKELENIGNDSSTEEENGEEKMAMEKVVLYKVLSAGDIMPPDQVNHSAVSHYDTGVVNWRFREYEFDVPDTNFCFHCDRNLINTHFNRILCLTEHRHDILYGVLRCRIHRDINLCSECYHTKDLTEVVRITPRAKKLFVPLYPSDVVTNK